MKKHMWHSMSILILNALVLAGCKSVAEVNLRDTRRDLVRAGFEKLKADTPEKLAHLKALEQLVVTKRYRNGELFYFYADSIVSKSLYVGRVENYLKYSGINANINRAEQNDQSAMNETADMRMVGDSLGPWEPWAGEFWRERW
ncbi:MAG: hypothetical protein GXP30_11710 [Verrucomicrobia bacterium]|nr:hypothetical protein [Verrucomicrobiota bacterium]